VVTFASVRARPRLASLFLLPLLLATAACRRGAPADLPWARVDFWETKPEVVLSPVDSKWARPVIQRIAFLGAAEVRNMSLVPAAQLVAFPRRTAGQIRALEQMAGSRLKWPVELGREPYFSFIPLGFESPCACTYRMGLRDAAGTLHELYREAAEPVGRIAQATVDVDLSEWAGTPVEILLQIEGAAPAVPGQPVPTALWGSPALYHRQPAPAATVAGRAGKRPNILLIGIDTLRADHVGAWAPGHPSLTPELDRLAAESDVWLQAFSTFNVTNPSFASIHTGLYGKHHGIYDLKTPLPESHTTLAEVLKKAGYSTLAIISAHHLGDHNSGLGQGFDEITLADEHFAGELAADMAMDWIGGRPRGGAPFFAWVHLFDPHTPHTPPQPYALGFRPAAAEGMSPVRTWVPFRAPGPRDFDEPVLGGSRDLYDGEVAYLDHQVGRLLGWMRGRGLLENTVVAVVADHGENLGEYGIRYRHVGLHDTTTHVPLMIRWPGAAPKEGGHRFDGLVQTIDLFPTLLGTAGVAVPPQDGIDLRHLTGGKGTGRRAVFAEHAGQLGAMVRTRDFQYLVSQGNVQFFPDGVSLYDLKADPGEAANIAGQGRPAERELGDLLRRFLADQGRKGPRPRSRDLSPEETERLKALGYL
jgi:arylsulfatase